MSLRALMAWALSDLGAAGRRSILSVMAVAVAVWALTLIVGLGQGVRQLVLEEVIRELPLDMVEVVTQPFDLGVVQLDASWLGGARGELNDETLVRLRALPTVAEAYPRLALRLPMGAEGGGHLLGRAVYTDVFVDAVDGKLLHGNAANVEGSCSGPLPFWISEQLVDIFNGQIAGATGLPQLHAEVLTGLGFTLHVGRSIMLGGRRTQRQGDEPARLAGVSPWAMRMGLTTTVACAGRLWRDYGEAGSLPPIGSILLRARRAAVVPLLTEQLEAMGLSVDKTAIKTRRVLSAATWLGASFGGIVLCMAAFGIGHSFLSQLNERRRELGVLRALGARRLHLMGVLLAQASGIGLCGAIIGRGLTEASARGIDAAVARWLPHFPFRPDSFFVLDAWLWLIGLTMGTGASIAGAILPAWRAANRNVAAALADT